MPLESSYLPYSQLSNKQVCSDYVLSSQTEKLMAATKFSDYLGLKHYKKGKKIKHFIHLGLAQQPQSFSSYHILYHLQGIQATN